MLRALFNVLRGALIGIVETIPGVSGGTVALIVGIYEDLIGSAGHLVRGAARAVVDVPRGLGLGEARTHLRRVDWRLLFPVGVGMAAAIVIGARIFGPLLENHPVPTRALFAGLIVASIAVPVRMVGQRWGRRESVLALLACAAAFLLTGIPPTDPVDPALWMVAIAAAVAVCALVLPGVSGSFLLLAFGLYAPTLDAVNNRDLGYLAVFALGAAVGLASFVSLLQWLLEERRGPTLAVMAGLMAGALRALWPWQSADGALHAPQGSLTLPIVLFITGIVAVAAMVVIEARVQRRPALHDVNATG